MKISLFFSIFTIFISANYSVYAKQMSEQEINEAYELHNLKILALQQQINDPDQIKLADRIEQTCSARLESIEFEKKLYSQVKAYPELKEYILPRLNTEILNFNEMLAFKNTNLCDVLKLKK